MTRMYEKPQAIAMVENHEGVYMASGAGGAQWNVSVKSDQSWNGTDHVFTVECTLNGGQTYSVSDLTIVVTFNNTLAGAKEIKNEFDCLLEGNKVTLKLNKSMECGPGYKVYANLWVHTDDQGTTEGLSATSCTAE